MKRMPLLSESKTESIYHLQTVPPRTYVLNYVLASTIGKSRLGRKQKNRTPKSAKKSLNTKKKSGVLILPIFGGLSDKTLTCGLYHPKRFFSVK